MASMNFIPPARRGLLSIGQAPPAPPTTTPGGVGQFDMPPAEEAMADGGDQAPSPFAGGTANPQAASAALNAAFAKRPPGYFLQQDDPAAAAWLATHPDTGDPGPYGDHTATATADVMPHTYPSGPGSVADLQSRRADLERANPEWAFDAATANQNRRFADPGQTAARDTGVANAASLLRTQYVDPERIRAQGLVDAATAHATGESDAARIKAEGAATAAGNKADAAQKVAAHLAEVIISRGTKDEATGQMRPLNDAERTAIYREAGLDNPASQPGIPGDKVLTEAHISQYITAHPGSTRQQAIDAGRALGFQVPER